MSFLGAAGAGALIGLGALQYGTAQLIAKLKHKMAGDPRGMLPADQQEFLNTYIDSMGLAKGLPGAEAFNAYVDGRIKNADGFAAIKVGDQTLGERLKAAAEHTDEPQRDAAAAIKTGIEQALALHGTTTAAQETFAAKVAEINQAIADPAFRYDPAGLVSRLHVIRNEARSAINTQHEEELHALADKFAEGSDFRAHLETIGMDDEQIEQLQKDMETSLKESHQKELAAFDKTMNERLTKMHQEAQNERDRIHILAAMYENNATMRRIINELADKNRKPKGTGGITLSLETSDDEKRLKKVLFQGIQIQDLETIETVAGRSLTRTKDGGFAMEFPHRLSSPFYYGGWNSKMKEDIMSMVLLVKASGHETITMSLNHKDPEHANELARKAYEACLEAGYKEDEITIKVNGKELSAEQVKELYKEYPSRLQAVTSRAQMYQEEREKHIMVAKDDKGAAKEFDTALQKYREEKKAAAAAEAATLTTPEEEATRGHGHSHG
ncbi:hypothetical protein [Legionella oakridgensis]|uniref:Coiled coil domain-containing protein n=2 Tax=Legionella oakridgensis TaxID=29423 RepID=W0BB87_9GAMM|nr:hypothetical protein [Legionella oakridgensis]AHE67773.1 hypothetical protein Loa_02231 [Legionella oakridgensis ATCC 33761 = DSM 21215]ETO92674.1 hypothetical protein LOR_34c02640 [Legionella oakridgensis RV-2-2007]KTD36902.1 coiled coil domain-containing protein [Legionella oakridgensis]STY20789.1 coiled coil domain protein [Legionella longbeachae]